MTPHARRLPAGWVLAVFAPRLVFGWARERFGCIYSALALHVA